MRKNEPRCLRRGSFFVYNRPMADKLVLGSSPLGRLMVRLALPSIFAQVVNILYTLVDRVYIGHIKDASSHALTGVGICFPVITLISAFSLFAGAGGAPLAAIELGKSEFNSDSRQEAHRILGNACLMLLLFSVILTAFFEAFADPVLRAFGASDFTAGYAREYLKLYVAGTVFVQAAVGLNPFIVAQGHSRTAMLSTVIGAVLNILLDPLFIFVLGLGVKGAAIATVISQGASALWVVLFLSSSRSSIRLRPCILKPRMQTILRISSLGISPFIMASTESAIFVVFNSGLQKYGGDIYVGAMTVMQSLSQLLYVPVQGFTDGIQPAISYNYGARKISRVKSIIKRMTVISFLVTFCFSALILVFRRSFAEVFTSSPQLIALIEQLLPVYFGGTWLFGIQMAAQRTFVGLGKARISIFIALLRKVVLLIPLALILPRCIGVNGIFWAEPIASVSSALTSFVMLIACYRTVR